MGNLKACQKCGKVMDETAQFYLRKNGTRMDLCKKCLTMHINNYEPETFLWILKDMDLPYVPEEWNVLRDRAFETARQKGKALDGMSVFGKYLSKMKLKQWKSYGWEDSERLQAINAEKKKAVEVEREKYEEHLKEQLDNGEITEAQYRTLVSTSTQNQEQLYAQPIVTEAIDNPFGDGSDFMPEDDLIDLGEELTEDDKKYLAMKWGRLYKPAEWVELEKTYKEMTESFDIQDADTINTLILICKTNLKMNQYLDSGDIEGFQKISKVSESLRKTAKFTAAQNKEDKDEYVDSVGELISMCERDGFIPRYVTEVPQDKVDATLKDMNDYVKKLVTQDLGFGQQIEDALKKIQIQKEMEESFDQEIELDDNDFEEYHNAIEEQKQLDEEELGDE